MEAAVFVWMWLGWLSCAETPVPPVLAPAASGPRHNFIVIVADDMGTDKIGVYGEAPDPPATPHLDALAEQGVWFRNAYVTPVCSASRAMLMTGRYGRRTGVGTVIADYSRFGLQSQEITIPEALDRGGNWSAAAIGKWHLTGQNNEQPFLDVMNQGFDRVRGSPGNLRHRATGIDAYTKWEKNVDGVPEQCTKYATDDTTDEAIAALRELPEPFFIWVAYNAGHEPFHWPPGVTGDRNVRGAQYDATITYMDQQIGRLLAAMSPEQRQHTTVVFLGDNGTPPEAVRPPFRAEHAKSSIHEGGTNVPFIVAGAGVTGRGESKALVSGADLLPTVLELAGVSSEGLVLDGVSFASVLQDPQAPGLRHYVYTEILRPNGPPPYMLEEYAIRDDRYKLVHLKGGKWARYDLEGRYDDGPRLPPGIAVERFEALGAEVKRIRETARFEYR